MANRFSRLDVSEWEVDTDEPAGAEEKLWLRSPAEEKWLFKPVTIKNGHRQGEDWAEKAASHLAGSLGIPCARVELATWNGYEGSISLNLRPDGYDLQPGYVYLQACNVEGYQPGNVPGRPGHSLANISKVLDGVLPPPGCQLPSSFTAFDVFCGYVVFDAWIANRDRHDENWAVLVPQTTEGSLSLCGSYDHASSLGFNLREVERQDRVAALRGGVETWAKRGTAWRFEHDVQRPVPTLVALAGEALRLASSQARAYWLERIDSLSGKQGAQVVNDLVTMSEPARTFAVTLLDINARRLHDECHDNP